MPTPDARQQELPPRSVGNRNAIPLWLLAAMLLLSGCSAALVNTETPAPSIAASPVISPNGGSFTTVQSVTLTDATPGATIFYTTDGTTPTSASTRYTAPITINASSTIRAIATASGYTNSAVASAAFTITLPQPVAASPVISPNGGSFTTVQTVTLSDTTPSASIFYTSDGTTPTPASTPYTGPISLSTTTTLQAIATATGYTQSPSARAVFTITLPTTATPVISPNGGIYTTAQTVTLSDATPSASIFYTTDGSTPTTASSRYTAPLTVAQTQTLRALALAPGMQTSAIAQAPFTIPLPGQLSGSVSAARKPLSGASIRLYAAGATGYGSPAISLLASTVLTDASGSFTTAYTCPSASTQVYLIASASSLVLATALGDCGNIANTPIYTVNELSTIAAAWALAQFTQPNAASTLDHLGASSTNATGLRNAMLNAMNLVDSTTGGIGGPALPSNTTLPAQQLNTLANLLVPCALGSCITLLQAATPPSGTQPADTFTAAIDIALNPGNNVAQLFALASNTFTPALTAAPTDWLLPVSHTGGGLHGPTAVAINATGNIWAADYYGALSAFSPVGAPLSPSTGFTGGGLRESFGLTIDPSNNIWVTNEESAATINGGLGSISKFGPAGQLLSGASGFGSGTVNFPFAIAADPNGNIWVANDGNATATLLASTGAALSPSTGFGSGHLSFPVAVVADPTHHGWFANQGSSTITSISTDGTQVLPVSCCDGPSGIALDQQGNFWVANFNGNSVSQVSPTGATLSAGFTGGGLNRPQGIAVDGAGNVWVANYHGDSLTELQGASSSAPGRALSGTAGFGTSAGLNGPYALAIDPSGSLWVTSFYTDTLVQYVGAAAPLKTPLLGLPQKP